ncbi:MAG: hypothetical protein Q9169_002470 [Polycauliona sp. 2 TL-2023]
MLAFVKLAKQTLSCKSNDVFHFFSILWSSCFKSRTKSSFELVHMSLKPLEVEATPSSPTFKVLRILPPSFQPTEIICEISWELLSEPPEYEALSYTWGASTQDQPIQIRTVSSQASSLSTPRTYVIHVTKHLLAALLRLRRSTASRRVWIDQLCIDQNSIEEKNTQVKLMADIYQTAKRTVVWLGELDIPDIDRDAIISATDRTNFRPIEREYSTPEDQLILKDLIGFGAQDHSVDSGRRRRSILAGLLNRPWFTRAWVYQEVVVAQSGVVLCGSLEMEMDIFINLLDGVCNLDFQETGEAASIMHASRGYKPMFAIREARFEARNGLSSSKKSRWLSTIWQAMGNLDATNPRDKVYAFLAFADSTDEHRISPSYGNSIEVVYADATVRSIHSVGSLDVLELAIKSVESSPGLPSWVPDFSKPLPSSPFMTHNVGSTEFHASKDSKHVFQTPNTNLNSLTVRGHILSTVATICPRDFHDHQPSQTFHDWINLTDITAWVQSQSQHSTTETFPKSPKEASPTLGSSILRTLLASGAGSDDTPDNLNYTDPVSIVETYHNESTILSAIPTTPRAFNQTDSPSIQALKLQIRNYRWIQKILHIMQNKKFFLTAISQFGLAYEAVREGDLIFRKPEIEPVSPPPDTLGQAKHLASGPNPSHRLVPAI